MLAPPNNLRANIGVQSFCYTSDSLCAQYHAPPNYKLSKQK